MNWNGWQDFLHMGGYAGYVWGSFGAVALLLALEMVLVRRRLRRARAEARRLAIARGRTA